MALKLKSGKNLSTQICHRMPTEILEKKSRRETARPRG